MWSTFWVSVVVLNLALAVACGENGYVKDNKQLLGTIPTPEGAEVDRQESSPYYVYETDEVDGYTTNTVYTVSGMTDEEVIQFYIGALGGEWEYCRESHAIMPVTERGEPEPTPAGYVLLAQFMRGDALVSVNTTAMSVGGAGDQYELVVDHDSGQNFCATEPD